ncbi:MAG: sigma 54-interacting transcriptional regulator [Desulfovibrio sp.]|nr:sigma 54-interacting transcriptional regulator [Desulfovibrio sp.]
MNGLRIGFVSNSTSTAQILSTYAPALGVELDIRIEAMEKAYTTAKMLIRKGIDVILACGSTGKFLREKLPENVIALCDSQISLLDAFQRAKRFARVIAFPLYGEIHSNIDVLAKSVGIEIIPICFHNTKELILGIRDTKRDDIRCLVGSTIATTIAKSVGYQCEEIVYSEYEVKNLLDQALFVASNLNKQKTTMAFLSKAIEKGFNKGVLIFDKDISNLAYNSEALKIFQNGVTTISEIKEIIKKEDAARRLKDLSDTSQITIRKRNRFDIQLAPVYTEDSFSGVFAEITDRSERNPTVDLTLSPRYSFDDIIGESTAVKELRRKAECYAQTDAAILIQGESGTGKELLAHSIHAASPRRAAPFVALNCASLSETLLESELFGYEEGAFTGAKKGGREGLFERANKGTIFLDEIGDISSSLQVRLLRVLEAKEIMRVGGNRIIPVDVRVISSSWRSLPQEVAKQTFRPDLYFRLSVLTLRIPPLRERLDDIPLLVRELLSRRYQTARQFPDKFFDCLRNYEWPGNIRELDTFLQRYLLLSPNHDALDVFLRVLNDIQAESALFSSSQESSASVDGIDQSSLSMPLKEALDAYEYQLIRNSLAKHHYNKKETAKALGISFNTLWRKLSSEKV